MNARGDAIFSKKIKNYDDGEVRTRALSDWSLNPAP